MNFYSKRQQQQHQQQQKRDGNLQKRKIYLNTKDQYEYEDIVLRDINVFKPNHKMMENIRKMEEIVQHQKINKLQQLPRRRKHRNSLSSEKQPGDLKDIINIKGNPRKGLKISICSRCESTLPVTCCYNTDNAQQQNTGRKIHCQVLGPLLCKECHLTRKVQEKEEATERVVQHFDIRDYKTDKEKAIFKILSGQNFMNSKGFQEGYTARHNTPLVAYSKRNMYNYSSNSKDQNSLRNSLKLATYMWKEIEEKNNIGAEDIEIMKLTNNSEEESVETLLDNEIKQRVVPPNSLSTPRNRRIQHLPSPAPSMSRSKSPANHPRTDLEWYYEISQKTHENKQNEFIQKQHGGIDVILLATKLSEIFKQRYLPPERTSSRISSVSSVDLLDYGVAKSNHGDDSQTPSLSTLQAGVHGKHVRITSKTPEERLSSSREIYTYETIGEEDEERKNSSLNDGDDGSNFLSTLRTEPPLVNMEAVKGYFTPHQIENF